MRMRRLPWLPAVLLPCASFAQDTQAPSAVPEALPAAPYGSVVTLSGARSVDAGGGQIASYTWTRLSGEGGEFPLNQPRQTDLPTFELAQYAGNPLRPGSHRFQLQVTDTAGNVSSPATVEIVIIDNIPPVAVLGALPGISHGAPLVLHGEHSADIPGRVVQWRFSRIQGPEGPVMPLNQVFTNGSGNFSVTQYPPSNFLAPGTHVFRLVVVDDAANQSAPRDVSVTVASPVDTSNPTAVLQAPTSIGYGTPLTLSAANSADTGGGQVRRYEWMRLSGAGGAGMPLNQPVVTQSATFLVPQPAGSLLGIGRHRFRLAVEDTSGNVSSPVEREVVVIDNVPPTAVLDAPASVLPGEAFTLSGKRSTESGGRIVKYTYTRIAGSKEGPMPLNQPVVSDSYFINVPDSKASPYALGKQVFRLTVTDDSGNTSQPVDVAVNVVASR